MEEQRNPQATSPERDTSVAARGTSVPLSSASAGRALPSSSFFSSKIDKENVQQSFQEPSRLSALQGHSNSASSQWKPFYGQNSPQPKTKISPAPPTFSTPPAKSSKSLFRPSQAARTLFLAPASEPTRKLRLSRRMAAASGVAPCRLLQGGAMRIPNPSISFSAAAAAEVPHTTTAPNTGTGATTPPSGRRHRVVKCRRRRVGVDKSRHTLSIHSRALRPPSSSTPSSPHTMDHGFTLSVPVSRGSPSPADADISTTSSLSFSSHTSSNSEQSSIYSVVTELNDMSPRANLASPRHCPRQQQRRLGCMDPVALTLLRGGLPEQWDWLDQQDRSQGISSNSRPTDGSWNCQSPILQTKQNIVSPPSPLPAAVSSNLKDVYGANFSFQIPRPVAILPRRAQM